MSNEQHLRRLAYRCGYLDAQSDWGYDCDPRAFPQSFQREEYDRGFGDGFGNRPPAMGGVLHTHREIRQ